MSQPLLAPKHPRTSLLWHEDVRQLSSTLASDCDKAFNRTSTISEAETVRTSILSYKGGSMDWDTTSNAVKIRPLPSAPEVAVQERRTYSAPLEHRVSRVAGSLAPIAESKEMAPNIRIGSAPEASRRDGRTKTTIRYVPPSSPMSPVKVPRPLVVRKVASVTGEPDATISAASSQHRAPPQPRVALRQQYLVDGHMRPQELPTIDERNHQSVRDAQVPSNIWSSSTSKHSDQSEMSIESFPQRESPRAGKNVSVPRKNLRSRIGELFGKKKKTSKDDEAQTTSMSASRYQSNLHRASYLTSHAHLDESVAEDAGSSQSLHDRQIEPQQSWIARIFNVKPVAKFICFSVSKVRARQEVTKILKEWKRYGIRDVQIDKVRNIVFGKVAAKNYLSLKEVAFAGEIMTVVEHGLQSHLSIARFTQEQGAASSFNKVVQTLESVLESKGLLVLDDRKKRMMVKTLKGAVP